MKLKELRVLEEHLEQYLTDLSYSGNEGLIEPLTKEEKQCMWDIKELCLSVVRLS